MKTEKRDTDAACRVLQMCWKPTIAGVGFELFMESIYFNAIIMVIISDKAANNNESLSYLLISTTYLIKEAPTHQCLLILL